MYWKRLTNMVSIIWLNILNAQANVFILFVLATKIVMKLKDMNAECEIQPEVHLYKNVPYCEPRRWGVFLECSTESPMKTAKEDRIVYSTHWSTGSFEHTKLR
jgi:hypothetical protein